MEKLTLRDGESAREFLQRLKKTINTPEWQEKRKRARFIREWKTGRISSVRQVGRKLTPGAKFHSPGEEE